MAMKKASNDTETLTREVKLNIYKSLNNKFFKFSFVFNTNISVTHERAYYFISHNRLSQ